jgi:superfamily II DNA or RNA helicase
VISLSEQAVYAHFGHTYAARGDSYQRSNRVSQPHLDPSTLTVTGKVQGTEPQAYEVTVKLRKYDAGIKESECSCPMHGFCKHSAALLLHVIRVGIIQPARIKDKAPFTRKPAQFELKATPIVEPAPAEPKLSQRLENWLSNLELAIDADDKKSTKRATNKLDSVLYLLEVTSNGLQLNVAHARRLLTGGWGKTHRSDIERVADKTAAYIDEEDSEIAKLFIGGRDSHWLHKNTFPGEPEICRILFKRILATNRCFWQTATEKPLVLGETKKANMHWHVEQDGKQSLKFKSPDPALIPIVAGGIWYLNKDKGKLGELELPIPWAVAKQILNAPAIEPEEALALSNALGKRVPGIPKPLVQFETEEVILKPIPRLKLITTEAETYWHHNVGRVYIGKEPTAVVTFDYGDTKFDRAGGSENRSIDGNKIILKKKDLVAEKAMMKELEEQGLRPQLSRHSLQDQKRMQLVNGQDADWLQFSATKIPLLKDNGWQIEIDKSFHYEAITPEEQWEANATEGSDFWFSLDLGITIEGQKVPLLPIINQALERLSGSDPLAEIERMSKDGQFYAPLKDGRYVALPFARIKSIVEVLIELFDRDAFGAKTDVQITLPQMIELARNMSMQSDLTDSWLFNKRLKGLIEKVKHFDGIKTVEPPSWFRAELRPYQVEGLSWLNFLREFELGGILADDMGLGKTIQTLAHIACEKEAKRLDKPYLVICPTSVLPNWQSEVNKFAPKLKVTALYGPDRFNDFPKISKSDIVLTTYPLISRDIEVLAEQEWKAVILDEAQAIKNPATHAAHAVRSLRTQYRIGLSGTPIENHLGELWSQFNFLMPGFLGDQKTFTKTFRTPIEKQKNKYLQKHLSAKVRPFLLRRTKELVAKELPEKTVMVKTVQLEGAQRDLYETVRLAMYEKVRETIASKGMAKSQIIILDALLKLRQACCDPRLVSLKTAKNVHTSAKLHLLLEMLEELLSEGKRILLFSQFTSMLDLIIPELAKRDIEFVEIRGDTKDRATPVKRFQNGQVPLFLLSLKAGGTGLNLTAADTVIHYDPWWNPAVEEQATDRAHRIGQDKAVFVFKLIAAGTIEEKMLELQERKRAIADGIYGDENSLPSKLTAEDLESLFSPLESEPKGTKHLKLVKA